MRTGSGGTRKATGSGRLPTLMQFHQQCLTSSRASCEVQVLLVEGPIGSGATLSSGQVGMGCSFLLPFMHSVTKGI